MENDVAQHQALIELKTQIAEISTFKRNYSIIIISTFHIFAIFINQSPLFV